MRSGFRCMWGRLLVWALLSNGMEVRAQSGRPAGPEAAPESAAVDEGEEAAALKQEMAQIVAGLAAVESTLEEKSAETRAAQQALDKAHKNAAAERGRLTDELDGLKARLDTMEKNPTSGYDDGFFVRSKNGRVSLKLAGFAQPVYTLSLERQYRHDSSGRRMDRDGHRSVLENGMRVSSARLMLNLALGDMAGACFSMDYGQAFDAPIYSKQYELPRTDGLLGDRSPSPRLRVFDLYAEYRPLRSIRVRAGQLKVPFDKESAFEPTETPFIGGSLVTHRYHLYGDLPLLSEGHPYYRRPYETARAGSFGRDVGAEVSFKLLSQRIGVMGGVFNGAGLGAENDNRDVLAALRLEGMPLGAMTPGVSDSAGAERPLLAVGAAFAFDLLEHQSPYDISRRYNSADYNLAVDVHFKWRGLHALGGLFYRHSDHGGGVFEVNEETLDEVPVDSIGGMFQLGYYFAEAGLLPGIRYALYDARLDRGDDQVHQLTGTLNYVVFPKHLRMILEYSALLPANKSHSYLAPGGAHADTRHDTSLLAEVAF